MAQMITHQSFHRLPSRKPFAPNPFDFRVSRRAAISLSKRLQPKEGVHHE